MHILYRVCNIDLEETQSPPAFQLRTWQPSSGVLLKEKELLGATDDCGVATT